MGEGGGRGRGAGRNVAMRPVRRAKDAPRTRHDCESEAISLSLRCLPQRVGGAKERRWKKKRNLGSAVGTEQGFDLVSPIRCLFRRL
jgi:hypothetical protein